MKSWGLRILKGLGLAVVGYLVFAFFAPSSYYIERSKKIGASPEIIYEQLASFENWENWSPWQEKDISRINTYQGESGKVGAKAFWKGDSKISGSGNMEMIQLIQNSTVSYELNFDGREMNFRGGFEIIRGEFTSEVIWHDGADIPFLFRPIAVLSDLESQIIPSLERGLERLDSVAESKQREYELEQAEITSQSYGNEGFESLLTNQMSAPNKLKTRNDAGSCKTWPYDLALRKIVATIKD